MQRLAPILTGNQPSFLPLNVRPSPKPRGGKVLAPLLIEPESVCKL
ncbi:MAG: hypothetical protein OJF52_002873 [Nitrospira sp.]|nr:MAG: hypothetical protein OJF52_002873 [Nitrospira sp.]